MNCLIFDSRNPRCKTPFGALPTGTGCTLRIFVPIAYQMSNPYLLVYKADRWDEPKRIRMEPEASNGITVSFICNFRASAPQLYFYRFSLTGANGTLYISRDPDGFGQLGPAPGELWQLTVYDANMHTPDFLRSGVMYQIFPDRFCNSGTEKEHVPFDRSLHNNWYELPNYLPDRQGEITNSDYFGGDLRGIMQKLPYLQEMGVTVLYLNPIFEAHSNHRYNTADYMKIDPLLGTDEDFAALCAAAKELGISILLDGVFNHAGSDSVYFNKERRYGSSGAYNDPQSPYRSWFEFTNYPHKYACWWGFKTLPNFNERDPSFSEFICGEQGVLHKWMRLGAAGYRLDVADELPDEFLDKICARIRMENPDAAVIGEVWEDASTKVAYGVRRRYFLGRQLDSVMNYPFKEAILAFVRYGASDRLYSTILSILEHYPKPVLDVLMNSLSTHDVERAITALGGEPVGSNSREWQGGNNHLSPDKYAHGKRLFKLASILQYTLPGIPCLYYGDEAGLYGYKDPFNRTCYPWGREDQELLTFFKELGRLRREYPELSSGHFTALHFQPNCVAYLRELSSATIFVAVNRTDTPVPLHIPSDFRDLSPFYGSPGRMLDAYDAVILVDDHALECVLQTE